MSSSLDEDYRVCLRLAREHYENFPVASWFLASNLRPHVAAVYAFARQADDYADEEPRRARRLILLSAWRRDLRRALGSSGTVPSPVLRALAASVRKGQVPAPELFRLLDAFEHDAREKGYESLPGLKAYCRNSACSIGRILLHLHGVKAEEARRASDALCTALQMTNFWQDLSRDLPRGRLTLPRRESRRFGLRPGVRGVVSGRPLQRLLESLTGEARTLFRRARALPSLVPSGLSAQTRLTLAGGLLVLDRVEALGTGILRLRPRLRIWDAPRLLVKAFL